MNETPQANASTSAVLVPPPIEQRPKYKKVDLKGDHPTWCPGCGDFSVLEIYFRLCERRQVARENIVSIAGIGCSSRFPYFVQAHGAHFIHGRAVAFATGLSLSRPDLHVFAFSGDGDAFSIGWNHLSHAARKNVHMTLVIMDNTVYGLTKKQTSPTSPIGSKPRPIRPVQWILLSTRSSNSSLPVRLLWRVPRTVIRCTSCK